MNAFKEGWFSEVSEMWPGMVQSLEVEKVLHEGQSKYQSLLVLQTKSHGRALVLDGIIQCTEKDEFSYQEMIAFLPLSLHPAPRSVLIVGGGDGGVAREVLKFPGLERICQVEIDEQVVEVSKRFLPFMAKGLDDPRLELIIGDGYEYVRTHEASFDVIITDSSDPIGPAACLFEEPYFTSMRKALKPSGIVCTQAGTYWSSLEQVKSTIENCKAAFPKVGYCISSVPTYPTGQIGYMLASTDPLIDLAEPKTIFSEEELDKMDIRYYSDKVHRAAFALPRFAKNALQL